VADGDWYVADNDGLIRSHYNPWKVPVPLDLWRMET
jgi:hypothetical protein